jgi:hypothetical protein
LFVFSLPNNPNPKFTKLINKIISKVKRIIFFV